MSTASKKQQSSLKPVKDTSIPYTEASPTIYTPLPKQSISKSTKFGLLAVLMQWGILIMSVIGGASVGVFYFNIQLDCQLLKSSWRLLIMIIALLPAVYWEYKKEKDTFLYSRENLTNKRLWIVMFWASLGHSTCTVATLISVNYTSIAQSYLFMSLHPIVLVIYSALKGTSVSRSELLGSLLATSGTVFLAFDDSFHSKADMVDLSQVTLFERLVFGDIVGIIGSIGAAFYFIKNQELKYDYPLYLGIIIMTAMGFIMISAASIILEGATFSFNPKNGLLGLFTEEWFVMYIYVAIVTGYGAYIACILAVKYFDALLVSIVLCLEPVTGALMVYFLGWQSFPGILTIVGFFFILPGIIVVTVEKSNKAKLENGGRKHSQTQLPLLSVSSD